MAPAAEPVHTADGRAAGRIPEVAEPARTLEGAGPTDHIPEAEALVAHTQAEAPVVLHRQEEEEPGCCPVRRPGPDRAMAPSAAAAADSPPIAHPAARRCPGCTSLVRSDRRPGFQPSGCPSLPSRRAHPSRLIPPVVSTNRSRPCPKASLHLEWSPP